MARSITDAAMAAWLAELRNKAQYHGREVVEADRWYPSSKTCAACGNIAASLKLSERFYVCGACGHTDHRDTNAAKNLLAQVEPQYAETR